ncbi:hypothetical protein K3G63_02215 [Hymenobacter sp. HSC-4F20]|uniref:hypothetical protein n=1 Tax=Hymenobacter sp. HSC-4F20 TaxID=2864135 RepID=UPI001C73100B|nr:hypothetical protein [Hymenobacter sp. HSC-4F20]MBX0289231.1 hypothetical protein [Hymenobacter sp. HSC-4F20]
MDFYLNTYARCLAINSGILTILLILGYMHNDTAGTSLFTLSDKTALRAGCSIYLLGGAANLLLMVKLYLNKHFGAAIAYGVAVAVYLFAPFVALLLFFGSDAGPHAR